MSGQSPVSVQLPDGTVLLPLLIAARALQSASGPMDLSNNDIRALAALAQFQAAQVEAFVAADAARPVPGPALPASFVDAVNAVLAAQQRVRDPKASVFATAGARLALAAAIDTLRTVFNQEAPNGQ